MDNYCLFSQPGYLKNRKIGIDFERVKIENQLRRNNKITSPKIIQLCDDYFEINHRKREHTREKETYIYTKHPVEPKKIAVSRKYVNHRQIEKDMKEKSLRN